MPLIVRLRILAVVSLLLAGASSLCHAESILVDETVRYVNDHPISLADVIRGAQEREQAEKIGAPRRDMAFYQETLELLTDDELLVQYATQFAKERKFQLLDHERISRMVRERAVASGTRMTLREQFEARRSIERHETIEFILGFFESRWASISPADLWHDYQSRPHDFYRPPRARILEIMLRPSPPNEQHEIHDAQVALFKSAQQASDPAIKKIAASRLDAYLAATPAEQEHVLSGLLPDLVAQASRKDLDQSGTDLVTSAKRLQEREAAVRDPDQCFQELETIRSQLVGKDADAFRAMARTRSQGPGASDGGERGKPGTSSGMLEPGSEGKAFDDVVFTLKPGEMSPVFRCDQNACLVYVLESVPARYREFSEVSGEIETSFRAKHLAAIRHQAVAMLRAKACITDVAPLSKLIQ